MTREEFIAANPATQPVMATCTSRKSANAWARTFSSWDEQTYVSVAGDGYFEVLPLSQYEPWRGRISARFNAGKRVKS